MIVVTVGVLFALLHWNSYGPLTMPYMFVFSVIMSLVSLRDGGLELTIGAHTAVNWVGVGEVGALASGLPASQVTWPHLPALVVVGVLFYALTGVLVRRLCDKRRISALERHVLSA
jgi:membrane protease YdiL (CAAX protease family)